ncbi:uncharacterized protein LOC123532795 [Mercenaria mercenaria]|uniref:uncharacterized protein LOC123532795 n=1 Tax=Mercenaria mercenaria TaxID=6596 RepID=UPI00234FB403|nr:uncharacterized protein LOC123532795 [Mercenaria mercenaria]
MSSKNFRFVFIIISLYFQKCACKTILDEYFLQEGSLGHCGQNIVNTPSVIFRSHVGAGLFGGLNSYKADQQCAVTFQTENGHKILMQFTFFDLQQPDGSTCKDKIVVTELGTGSTQVTEFCTKQVFTSVTEKIEVKFISDALVEKKGFVATLAGFHEGTCSSTEYKCDTTRCISADLKCEGHEHCIDGADESKELAGCSTLDEIVNTETSLGKYTVLAIAVVVGGVILTIFVTVIFWKYLKTDGQCCQCSNDDVESNIDSPLPTDKRKHRVGGPGNTAKKTPANLPSGSSGSGHKVVRKIKVKGKANPDNEW